MNRITKKRKDYGYELAPGQENYAEENGIRLVQVVGEYEDLKEKLGCDPMIVLKALENGIYYRFDEKSEAAKTRKPMLRIIDNEFCFIAPKWITTTWMNVKLKEHGTKWALTKEELL